MKIIKSEDRFNVALLVAKQGEMTASEIIHFFAGAGESLSTKRARDKYQKNRKRISKLLSRMYEEGTLARKQYARHTGGYSYSYRISEEGMSELIRLRASIENGLRMRRDTFKGDTDPHFMTRVLRTPARSA